MERQCLHGYPSASKVGTCVCSHGWGGARCEVDQVPSCDRNATFACHNVVLGVVLARPGGYCPPRHPTQLNPRFLT